MLQPSPLLPNIVALASQTVWWICWSKSPKKRKYQRSCWRSLGACILTWFHCTFRYNGWFVDLYVRVSNAVAVGMYRKFGYSVYRRVRNYYSGATNEDAYDMRKPLPRDKLKETIRENGENIYVNPEELDSWRWREPMKIFTIKR